jgi:hypothetical protein
MAKTLPTTVPTSATPPATGPVGAGAGRRWFALDALVTAANAAVYLLAAGLLTDLLGADVATYRWVGAFLLAYAALVGWYAAAGRATAAGWAVVVANEVWVVASLVVAVLGTFDLTAVGRAWVVAQAVVVGAFAVLQARALRAGRG